MDLAVIQFKDLLLYSSIPTRTTATTNCQARIRVKLWGDGLLHLELASLDHNHPVSPSKARFLNCNKHLTGFVKKKALTEQVKNLAAQPEEPAQSAHVDRLGAVEELLFGESNCRSFVERGRLRLGDGDSEALGLFFTRMQAKNSNFFNVVDLDEEGCARNVFWADARSRAVYQYYSDVVMLDTMSISEKKDARCICGSFEFRGILCRHALSVFKVQQVHEVPPQCVLDRWKDFKCLHVMNRPSKMLSLTTVWIVMVTCR